MDLPTGSPNVCSPIARTPLRDLAWIIHEPRLSLDTEPGNDGLLLGTNGILPCHTLFSVRAE